MQACTMLCHHTSGGASLLMAVSDSHHTAAPAIGADTAAIVHQIACLFASGERYGSPRPLLLSCPLIGGPPLPSRYSEDELTDKVNYIIWGDVLSMNQDGWSFPVKHQMTKDASRPIAWLSDCDHQRNSQCSIPADINNQGSC